MRVHLKLDTGMGRWGLSELPAPPVEVVGLMSHLATADTDAAYTEWQIERFRSATAPYTHLTRHIANSAAALRYPSARFDAARCGIALYGLSPFGADPAEDGLEPVLLVDEPRRADALLRAGESTGYGRRFVAERRHVDRNRPRRLRRRLPARPDRDAACASPASCDRSSAPSRWMRSPSSSTASCRSGRRSC